MRSLHRSALNVSRLRGIGLGLGLAGFASAATAAPGQPSLSAEVAASDKLKVVASVQAKNLDATLAMLREYLPVPFSPDAALRSIFGDLSPQVALSAPANAVVVLEPQGGDAPAVPHWAFSVGVRNLDETYRLAQRLGYGVDGKPAAARLRPPEGRGLFCLLQTGTGAQPGRLSCSQKERDRDLAVPYLLRQGATAAATQSDLSGEVAVDTLVNTYDPLIQRGLKMAAIIAPQKLQLGHPGFDRALTDLVQVLAEQLQAMSKDLQSLNIDLSIGKNHIEARLGYRLTGANSWWGQAEAEGGTAGGAPPLFFTLPEGSSAASFYRSDIKWAQKVLGLFLPLFDGFLSFDKMPDADRQAVLALLNQLRDASHAGIFTSVMAVQKSGQAQATGRFDPAALLSEASYLVGTDGSYAWTIPWLKSLVAVYNRPGVQAYLRAKWKKLDPSGALPSLRAEALPKTLIGAYGIVLSGNFAALTKEGHGVGKPAAASAPPLTLHLYAMPVAGKMWMVMGSDRAALLKQLSEQAQAQPPGKTLAERGGLEALRDPAVRSGGYTSLLGLSSYLDAILAATHRRTGGKAVAEREAPQRAVQLLSRMPHHGEIPLVYVVRKGRPETGARSAEMSLQVPRLFIEDLTALFLQLSIEK